MSKKSKQPKHFSDSLARGLAVIKAFGRQAPLLRITDVAAHTGLTRAAARRFLLTLLDIGYVGRSDDLFYLRPRALDIGFSYLASLDTSRVIQPFLNEMTTVTGETSGFAILDGLDIRLLARSANNQMMNVSIPIGSRTPACSTAIGRVLLAGLSPAAFESYLASWAESGARTKSDVEEFRAVIDQVRNQGWAVIEKSPSTVLCAIAVPVRDRDGRTIAGINVAEYPPRSNPKAMVRKYLRLLEDARRQIEGALTISQHTILAPANEPTRVLPE